MRFDPARSGLAVWERGCQAGRQGSLVDLQPHDFWGYTDQDGRPVCLYYRQCLTGAYRNGRLFGLEQSQRGVPHD